MNPRTVSVLIAIAGLAGHSSAQSFTDGDIYLVSELLPKMPSGTQPGVLRVEPGTWQTTLIFNGPDAGRGRATYDPFRDRIVMQDQSTGLLLLAADGTTTTLAITAPHGKRYPSAGRDGRIYYIADNGNANKPLGYVDAANVAHDVLNPGRAGVATTNGVTPRSFYFDPDSNSLLLGLLAGAGMFGVERIALNAAGNEVVSRATATGTIGGTSVGDIMGFSPGPNGQVFIKLDNNDNTIRPRMQLMDVGALAFAPFASSGYFGVGGEVAGAYSFAAGKAVVLDTGNDQLRAFALGESGPGQIVAGGVSPVGSSGELAQIITVIAGVCRADFDGDGFVTGDDFDAYVAAFEGGDLAADFNGDGFVTGDDFDGYVAAFEAGC